MSKEFQFSASVMILLYKRLSMITSNTQKDFQIKGILDLADGSKTRIQHVKTQEEEKMYERRSTDYYHYLNKPYRDEES